MKKDIKVEITITSSKILSYLIFIGGIIASIYLKDKAIVVDAMMYAALLHGVKSIGEKFGKNV